MDDERREWRDETELINPERARAGIIRGQNARKYGGERDWGFEAGHVDILGRG